MICPLPRCYHLPTEPPRQLPPLAGATPTLEEYLAQNLTPLACETCGGRHFSEYARQDCARSGWQAVRVE